MKKIIECVPNFSEGRNKKIIDAIAKAIKGTPECILLDVDPGKSTNRTVFTFIGDPESVIKGALNAARKAQELIDMQNHKGEHPRMGAMDVCPFIPVANVSMEECIKVSEKFARKAAKQLNVPFFLYENSAKQEYRKKLSQIREGEYEKLEQKLKHEKWKPDFGPTKFVPEWGASVTGARSFLIAYNVNILGTSNQAHRIALNLREAGRGEHEKGKLKQVKGMGWYVDEYNLAQVTVNLTNYKITPIHVMFENVKKEAEKLRVAVAGSEIVGLIPLDAILDAADYYIKKEDLFILDEDQKIKLVIQRLGLSSISVFNPSEKIIEYMLDSKKHEPLADMSLREFIKEVGSRSSAPGGGSVSAAIAAIGTGLGSMGAKLTYGVRKFEKLDEKMRKIIPKLHQASLDLIPLIDADTTAFNDYMEGIRMPKNTDKEKTLRFEKMQLGLKNAIEIPMEIMKTGDSSWDAMCDVAKYGNIASKSDIEVGAKSLETGIWGAYKNVLINMPEVKDENFKKTTLKKAKKIKDRAEKKLIEVLEILEKRITIG